MSHHSKVDKNAILASIPLKFDPITDIPTSATQFPPPNELNNNYNKHLFHNGALFRDYIALHADNFNMYSECSSTLVEQPALCTLNNTHWKKLDKYADLANAQRLILKHITLYHLLLPIAKSIRHRLTQVQQYFSEHVADFDRECELRFVEAHKNRNFSKTCDTTNRHCCSPIDQDPHHKNLYSLFERYNLVLPEDTLAIDSMWKSVYDNDLRLSYEYVIGLKASIATCHNEILAVQSIGLGHLIASKGKSGMWSSTSNDNQNLITATSHTNVQNVSQRDLLNSSIHMANVKEKSNHESHLTRRSSQNTLPTAFDFYFSPDIICLLWQQEYEKQFQEESSRHNVDEKNKIISSQKVKNTIASSTGLPITKIERGPYHLSRYTHWGAGLEITYRYYPDAIAAGQTFTIYSLCLTAEELRGVLSVPPPYHIIDRSKYGSILSINEAKEYVTPQWVQERYQDQFVCYTPRPALPTRVELNFLPAPPQKLYNIELTSLNYSLSGSPHFDIFIRYLMVEGDELEMYNECRLEKLKDIYVCELNHFKSTFLGIGKSNRKVDKKADLYSAQKLILKHAVITQRLLSLLFDMIQAYRTAVTDSVENKDVTQWLESEQRYVAKTQRHAVIYGSLVDLTSTLTMVGIPFQEMFNCYHRYTYSKAWLLLETKETSSGRKQTADGSFSTTLYVEDIYNHMFSTHLPLSYELIFRLKILLYTIYDRIVIIQSLNNSRWKNEIKKPHVSKDIQPDVLACIWFQHHYKPLSNQETEDNLDVQRKIIFREPNCFVATRDQHKNKPFSIQSLTLSDEEHRVLFRPPPPDAVLDVGAILSTAKSGFDGQNVPDWVNLAYCNRFSQYVYRPQIPTMRLPPLPTDVVDMSTFSTQNGRNSTNEGTSSPVAKFRGLFSSNRPPSGGMNNKGSVSPVSGPRRGSISKSVTGSHNSTTRHGGGSTDGSYNLDDDILHAGVPKQSPNKNNTKDNAHHTTPQKTTTLNNNSTRNSPDTNDTISNIRSNQGNTVTTGGRNTDNKHSTTLSQPQTLALPDLNTTTDSDFNDSPQSKKVATTDGGSITNNNTNNNSKDDDSTPRVSLRNSIFGRWSRKSNQEPKIKTTSSVASNDSNEPYITPLGQPRSPQTIDEDEILPIDRHTPSVKAVDAPTPMDLNALPSLPPQKNQKQQTSLTPQPNVRSLNNNTNSKSNDSFAEPTLTRLSSTPISGIPSNRQVIVDDDDDFFRDSVLVSFAMFDEADQGSSKNGNKSNKK